MNTNEPSVRRASLLEHIERDPLAAVVQALAIGLAVGLVLRLLEGGHKEKPQKIDIDRKPSLDEVKYHLGSLVLPFLWPAWQKAQEGYGKSTETLAETVEMLKKADLPRKGRKHWHKVEQWAAAEAAELAGKGKTKAQDVEKWVEQEVLPVAECGWKRLRGIFG